MERITECLFLHWYAIHTKPRQEERAELNLGTLKNVETFSPKVRERRLDPVSRQPVQLIKP